MLVDQVMATLKRKGVKITIDNNFRSAPMNTITWGKHKEDHYFAVVSNNTDYAVMRHSSQRYIPFAFLDLYSELPSSFPMQALKKPLDKLRFGYTTVDSLSRDLRMGHEWVDKGGKGGDKGKGGKSNDPPRPWWHPHLMIECAILIGTVITFPIFQKKGLWKKLDIPSPTIEAVSKWMRDVIYQNKMRWG